VRSPMILFSMDLGSKLLAINVPLMLVTVVYLFSSAETSSCL